MTPVRVITGFPASLSAQIPTSNAANVHLVKNLLFLLLIKKKALITH